MEIWSSFPPKLELPKLPLKLVQIGEPFPPVPIPAARMHNYLPVIQFYRCKMVAEQSFT
jgi:hypothetical protein